LKKSSPNNDSDLLQLLAPPIGGIVAWMVSRALPGFPWWEYVILAIVIALAILKIGDRPN
jgi:hypothetical protein